MDTARLPSLTSLLGIAAPMALVLAFIVVVWRTESLHVVMRRLWQLVHGNHEISDPEIRAFIDEQTSLVSFRLFAGVPIASLAEARGLIQWTKLNGVKMRTLRLCGEYFDPALRQVRSHKLLSRRKQVTSLVGAALAASLALVCLGNLWSDRALLTLKASQRAFLATTSEAKALRPFGAAPLRTGDCAQPAAANAVRTSFTLEEVNVLCGVLQNSGTPAFLKDALQEQRWALALLIAVSVWTSWLCLLAWVAGAAARSLAARCIDPSLPGAQRSLDFGASTSSY